MGVSVLRGQGVGLPTVKVSFWPGVRNLAWNRMEAEAFWELFKEYEDAGGDGYIHTVVQPAMNLLKVIDIEDAVSVLRLTNNRK